jgi:hypothetical protein
MIKPKTEIGDPALNLIELAVLMVPISLRNKHDVHQFQSKEWVRK